MPLTYNDDFTWSSAKHVISIIAQLSDSEIRNINSAASKTKSRTNGRGVSIFIAFSLEMMGKKISKEPMHHIRRKSPCLMEPLGQISMD
jgi:hypothetical protein